MDLGIQMVSTEGGAYPVDDSAPDVPLCCTLEWRVRIDQGRMDGPVENGVLPRGLDAMLRRHKVLTSLLVSGYVDADVTPEVAHLLPQVIYLGNNRDRRGYLRCYTNEANYLYIDEADALAIPDALLGESSIEPVFMDLSEYFISDVHEIEYEKAGLYLAPAPEGRSHLRGIAFYRAGSRQALVIDSFWPFGIKVGNEADLAQLASEASIPPIIISLQEGPPDDPADRGIDTNG